MTMGGLLVTISVQAGLAGCAAVGSGSFSCAGRPEGVRCAGVREVYERTQNTDQVAATADRPLGNNPTRTAEALREQQQRAQEAGEQAPTATPAGPAEGAARPADGAMLVGATYAGLSAAARPLVDRPTPVRTPAQVMRVWVAPWEDAKGVLHVGGYHFAEVVARRWTLGGPVNAAPARMFSINEPIVGPTGETGAGGASPVFGPDAGTQVGATGN